MSGWSKLAPRQFRTDREIQTTRPDKIVQNRPGAERAAATREGAPRGRSQHSLRVRVAGYTTGWPLNSTAGAIGSAAPTGRAGC